MASIAEILPVLAFLATVVFISLSGVMMPGPVTAVTIAKGRASPRAGAFVALGHGLVEFPLMIAIATGFATVLRNDSVSFYIGLVGGGMLLLMGSNMLRTALGGRATTASETLSGEVSEGAAAKSIEGHASPATPSATTSASPSTSMASPEALDMPMSPVAAGVVTTLSNPYWYLWWATVGLLLITRATAFGLAVLAAMMVAHWLCDFSWDWTVSALTYRSRAVWTPRVHRVVFSVCGLTLMGFGLWFGVGAVMAIVL